MTATDTQFENLSSQTANKFNFIFEKNVCIHDSNKLSIWHVEVSKESEFWLLSNIFWVMKMRMKQLVYNEFRAF